MKKDGIPDPLNFSLRSLLNSTVEGIIGVDRTGRHVFVNESAARILGYRSEELLGTESHATWHHTRPDGSAYPEDECPLHVSLKAGEPTEGIEHCVRKDGSFVPVEFTCRPVLEDNGITGAVISIRDISKVLEQEAERRILRTALEQSPVTAVITDIDGTIQYVNPQFEKTSGYTLNEVKGANPRVLKAGDQPESEYSELWSTIGAGRNWRGVFHNKRKNGELYWEEATISPVKDADGSITHFLALKQDVTEQRRAEEERRFQLSFRKVIAEISSIFAQTGPDTCNTAVEAALARLGGTFELGRCFLCRFSEDFRYAEITNEWCAPGVAVHKERHTHYPVADMQWWVQRLKKGDTLHIPNLNDLPPEAAAEKAELHAHGVCSCLHIPYRAGDGRVAGFVGFHAVEAQYSWSEDAVRMLKVVVESIGGAIGRSETTARLWESESRLRTILAEMSDILWSLNYPDLSTVFLSPSVEKIYGYPIESFEKDPQLWQKIIHPEDRHTVQDVMRQLEESGVGERECRVIRRDGELRWISDRSHLVRDKNGAPIRIDGIVSDITKRKQDEEEIQYQNRFQEMVAQVATQFIGVGAADIDGVMEGMLDQLGTFLEVDRASIVQSSPDFSTVTTTHEWYREGVVRTKDIAVRDYPTDHVSWFKSKLLIEQKPVQIPDIDMLPPEAMAEREVLTSFGIRSGLLVPIRTKQKVYGFMGIYTVGRSMEWNPGQVRGLTVISKILAQAFAAIDAEKALVAMKEEYFQAKETAEAANRAKSEFLSSMSHELRTPLNAVLGFSQIMEAENTLSEEHAGFVQEIFRAGQHLLKLVNELLDLAKIESGRIDLSLEPVSSSDVIAQAVSLITPLAQSYRVHLEASEQAACMIQADRTRLKQVLVNILSNAIKYNHPGGSVGIAVSVHDQKACIAVKDTGSGIPQERLTELFTQFSRLGRELGDIEGTGIGLALTRRLVELMNGTIRVESTVNEGSTFFVELPLAKNTPESGVSEPSGVTKPGEALGVYAGDTSQDNEPCTDERPLVLYIEDNPASMRLVEQIFRKRNDLSLLTAQSGSVGLDLAAVHHPACILVDINMPDMNGYEVLRRVKNSDWAADVPVIALSANAMEGSVKRGEAAGFDGYITKPINVQEFMEVLNQVLAQGCR